MRISRAAMAVTVLVGTTAAGFAVLTGTASADSSAPLPVTSFGEMAIDDVHKRVFVSDPKTGKVVATTYHGAVLGEVTGLTGVNGLSISDDRSVIYAAVPDVHAIVVLSTESITEVDRLPVGEERYPTDVAWMGGKVWFSFGDGPSGSGLGNFGSIDLVTDVVTPHDYSTDKTVFNGSPALFSGHISAGLAVADIRTSSRQIAVFDISGSEPRLKSASKDGDGTILDFAFKTSGDVYDVTSGSARQMSTSAYRYALRFDGVQKYTAVATGQDGYTAVAGVSGGYDFSPDAVNLFYQDYPNLQQVLPLRSGKVAPRGLSYEPWGSRIFAVVVDDGAYRLQLLNDPTPPPLGTPRELYLAFDTLWSGSPAKPLTVSGRVKNDAGAAPPAGTELTVTRTERYSGATKALGTVKTAADGRVSLTDTPPTKGEYHYAFRYAGSAQYNRFVETKVVHVERSHATLTLDRNNTVAAYGATVNVTATLGKTLTNRVVEIWADPAGSQPDRLIKKGVVSSTGKISASIKLTRNTAVTARFAGDGGFYDASRTVNLWTKVAASTTLKRHYKTAKIGTVRYQYFRKSTQPLITHTVTPYPGRKVRTTIQYWSGGKWKLWSARNTKLTSAGKASFSFLTAAKAGTRFRVQVSYLPGTTASTAGDRLNHTTNGPWKYFVLAK